MAKKLAEKLAIKRQMLVQRTAAALALSEAEATALLCTKRHQSVRVNPLKGDELTTVRQLRQLGWDGKKIAWMPGGYTSDSPLEVARDSAAAEHGQIFIQNAASWLPVLALDPRPDERILDVCAAPGGKTSHIAAITGNRARITANDNSRGRLNKMLSIFARLGVSGVTTTLFDAAQLSKKFADESFDKILLDAPCSGEGMRHLNSDADMATWSVAHIRRLQHLQKRIITQAWRLVEPGGTLVYSTCTIAPEENEAVVHYLLRTQPDADVARFDVALPNRVKPVLSWNAKPFDKRLGRCLRLQPSADIEAFFVCKLVKRPGKTRV